MPKPTPPNSVRNTFVPNDSGYRLGGSSSQGLSKPQVPPLQFTKLARCAVLPSACIVTGCEETSIEISTGDLATRDSDMVDLGDVITERSESLEEDFIKLFKQLDDELQLRPHPTRQSDPRWHTEVRMGWLRFLDVVDEQEFRSVVSQFQQGPSTPFPSFDVTLEKGPKDASFNFGVHCVEEDRHVMIVDVIVAEGLMDAWNIRMRRQGCLECIVKPFSAIHAVNGIAGDFNAMMSELVSSTKVKLNVTNGRSVRDIVDIVDLVRKARPLERPAFWMQLGKENLSQSAASPNMLQSLSVNTSLELKRAIGSYAGMPMLVEAIRGVFEVWAALTADSRVAGARENKPIPGATREMDKVAVPTAVLAPPRNASAPANRGRDTCLFMCVDRKNLVNIFQ